MGDINTGDFERTAESAPLWALKSATQSKLGHGLNQTLTLLTEDGHCRDWSGLLDLAGLPHSDTLQVKAAHNKTAELIKIWSSRPNITVKHLIEALESIERFDVIEDCQKQILADCEVAINWKQHDLDLVQHPELLTAQDVQLTLQGKRLKTFDAMVLYGKEDPEDKAFGELVITRLEAAGLSVFVPERDLIIGTYDSAFKSDVIANRCKKVVVIYSPCFSRDAENLHSQEIASSIASKLHSSKTGFLIPVIFKKCPLPADINILSKILYDPQAKFVNFWSRLYESLGVRKDSLPEELLKMDFHWPPVEDRGASAVGQASTPTQMTSETSTTTSLQSDCVSLATTYSVLAPSESDSTQYLLNELPDPPRAEPGFFKKQLVKILPKKKKRALTND